ncbi:MAG: hypothetical protein ACI85G_000886, partial [Psychroserpens sp.]
PTNFKQRTIGKTIGSVEVTEILTKMIRPLQFTVAVFFDNYQANQRSFSAILYALLRVGNS